MIHVNVISSRKRTVVFYFIELVAENNVAAGLGARDCFLQRNYTHVFSRLITHRVSISDVTFLADDEIAHLSRLISRTMRYDTR